MIILLTMAACCTADQAQNQASASHIREVERKSAQQVKTGEQQSVQSSSRHPDQLPIEPDASPLTQGFYART